MLIALNKSKKEFSKELKVSTAIRLYYEIKLTLGKAAQLAGLSRLEFEKLLSVNNQPISNLDYKDVEGDIKKLRD